MSRTVRPLGAGFVAALLLAAACSDSPTNARVGVPSLVEIVTGNAQLGTVGLELPNPVVAKVLDDAGRAVANQVVEFHVMAGGGTLSAASASTNSSGVDEVRWTLGTSTQGDQRLEARAVRSDGGTPVIANATATAQPGPVASLQVIAGDDQSALAGTPVAVAPSVRARDQYGNAVPGVVVNFAVQGGDGTIANASHVTDANGIATAGAWTLGMGSGTQTISVGSGSGITATVTAAARSRTPAQLTVVAGNHQTASVGAGVATAPAVLVRNAHGDPLPGVSVTFVPGNGHGTVAGAPAVSDANGIATVGGWSLGATAGEQTLLATADPVYVEFKATATSGTVASLTLGASSPTSAEVGSTVEVVVVARDEFGNPATGATVSFDVPAGAGSITPTNATTTADGRAIATWTLGTVAGQNTARARAGSVSVSVGVTGTSGPAARLTKQLGDAQAATVGSTLPIRPAVLVEDRHGNAVGGVTVTFAVTSGGGTLTGGTATTDAAGLAAAGSWTLGATPGSASLTASVEGVASVTFTATANARGAAHVAVHPSNVGGVRFGDSIRPSVIVTDDLGSPVQGAPVTFSLPSGAQSRLSGATALTDANGVATVGGWVVTECSGAAALSATTPGVIGAVSIPVAVDRNVAATLAVEYEASTQYDFTVGGFLGRPRLLIGGVCPSHPVDEVEATFTVIEGASFIEGATTRVATSVGGVVMPGSWRAGTITGNTTLQASVAGFGGLALTVAFGRPVFHGDPVRMEKLAGDNQAGVAGSTLPVAPSVRMVDQHGNPAPASYASTLPRTSAASDPLDVRFTGLSGGAGSETVRVGADGVATAPAWTLGSAPGFQTVRAETSPYCCIATTFTAQATASPTAVAGLAVVASPTSTAEVGSQAIVTVRAVNSEGAPIAGAHVSFEITEGNGSISPANAVTGADGLAAATWTLGTSAGQHTVRARSGVAVTAIGTVAVAGAPSAASKHAGDNQTAVVGTAVPIRPAVRVVDRFGNAVENVPVSFAIGLGGGSGGGTATTGPDGVATSPQWILGTTAMTNSLTASTSGLPQLTFTASGRAGAAAAIVKFAGDGQSAAPGTAVQVSPAVRVNDAYGNAVSRVAVTFSVTAGGGSVVGGSTVTDFNGTAGVSS